jgi:hypothetical protein
MKKSFLALLVALTAIYNHRVEAATVTQDWISKDESIATVVLNGNETIWLPAKGGGPDIRIACRNAIKCEITLKDFKDKKGMLLTKQI